MHFPWSKTEIDKLIEQHNANRAALAELQRKHDEEVMPAWLEIQTELEGLGAVLAGFNTIFPASQGPAVGPWEKRKFQLESEVRELVGKRDALIVPILEEIKNLKMQIQRPINILRDMASGWILQICTMIDSGRARFADGKKPDLRTEQAWTFPLAESGAADEILQALISSRSQLAGMTGDSSLLEIIDEITKAIDIVEAIPCFNGPLLRIESMMREAAA